MKRPKIRYAIIWMMLAALLAIYPAAQAGAQIEPTVRVWLKRLKTEDVLRIQVQGSYMLEDGRMFFGDGTEMTVVLRDGQLVLHTGPTAIMMGQKMSLIRCADFQKESALRLNGGDGRYEGDLHLTIQDNAIRPILHIYVEDYLLGVVPYEMGDSFPLEALKAQAIAARTYALQRTGSAGDYDVEDTTNDQAYKGRSSDHPMSEQAVRETEALCGTYQGKLADCYYSASNGGQTELGQHVWPTDDPDAYAYMDMRDDPYDLENDASTVKRFTLPKKPGERGVGTALHSALVSALADQLRGLGVDPDEHLIRFDEIVSLEAAAPKFEEPSRLMTELQFSVRISAREYTFRDAAAQNSSAASAQAGNDAAPTPSPVPTATPAYSPYRTIDAVLHATLPIFTEAEKAMGLSINVYENELVSVTDIGDAFMVESRRFGHGVGMSQRGAQQMAAKYGMTSAQILAFYYPGLKVMQARIERSPLPSANAAWMATPAPTPSPTPRPTLMPVTTEKLPPDAYVAVVSNINDDSSLNLRASPSLSSDVLRRLYKDQKLIVLRSTADGWSYVKTDVIEGYVRTEFLQAAGS